MPGRKALPPSERKVRIQVMVHPNLLKVISVLAERNSRSLSDQAAQLLLSGAKVTVGNNATTRREFSASAASGPVGSSPPKR